jgi:hypothetical protein
LPGVYTSIGYELCFINFATECLTSQTYSSYVNYPQCKSWNSEERKRIDERVRESQKVVDLKAGSTFEQKVAEIELEKAKESLKNMIFLDEQGPCGR